MTTVESLKKFCVALGYGSSAADYNGETIEAVFKELAVKMECAPSVGAIKTEGVAEILQFIADNKGEEEKEPYDLGITATNVTVKVVRKKVEIEQGTDILWNGDKLTITATPDEGYSLSSLTVNGQAFESGDKFTVNGHNVTIAGTGIIQTFDLTRTETNCTVAVTRESVAVDDGENVLEYGDEITITATAGEGYTMSSLTVNGEDFVSGTSMTVNASVEIAAVAEE